MVIQPQILEVPQVLTAPQILTLGQPATVLNSDRFALIANENLRSDRVMTLNENIISKLPEAAFDLAPITIDRFVEMTPTQPETGPPSTEPFHVVGTSGPAVFSIVRTEPDIDLSLSKVLGIEQAILPDTNPASGIYYYIPSTYRLAYDRDLGSSRGLSLRIDYDALSQAETDDAVVRIAMTLQAPLDGNGVAITQELMRVYAERQGDIVFSELRPLPMASVPEFQFGAALAGAVDEDNIAVVAFSDFLEGLQVSWLTDPVRAERIRRDLASEVTGLTGLARFTMPLTGELRFRDIPAEIRLSDPALYDAVKFDRSGRLTNNSALPVRLTWLHALVLAEAGGPRIYSWSLDDAGMAPNTHVELDLADFPEKIDDIADRIWVDYRLDPACEDCMSKIVASVLDGGVWPNTETITFDALSSLFAEGTVEVEVELRSRFFDPSERILQNAPSFVLSPDIPVHSIGPVFPDPNDAGPLFEYRLNVLRETGQFLSSDLWLPQDRTRVRPGAFQLSKSFGPAEDTNP